jgi:hypothetical protein
MCIIPVLGLESGAKLYKVKTLQPQHNIPALSHWLKVNIIFVIPKSRMPIVRIRAAIS